MGAKDVSCAWMRVLLSVLEALVAQCLMGSLCNGTPLSMLHAWSSGMLAPVLDHIWAHLSYTKMFQTLSATWTVANTGGDTCVRGLL